MLAAYDLDNRSSAVLPQTVRSLGFKPSRRVEILTTGRARRRRHRGGAPTEEERAEARRRRDERVARRATEREARERAPEPEPEPLAVQDTDTDDSGSEGFDESRGEVDLSDFQEFIQGARDVLAADPVQTQRTPSPVRAQAEESARQATIDAADSDDEPLTPAEQFFEDLRTRLNTDDMSPDQWWEAHVEAIINTDPADRVALATQLKDDLLEIKQDTDMSADTRRYFHKLWSQMPEIIVQLREEAAQQARKPTGREFIDDAKTSQQLEGDVRFRSRRGSFQRSPSPIRTPGFQQSGRFSDDASTISAIRNLSGSIVQDPRLDQEVSRLQGELSATQDMLQDLQLADATTRSKTVKALQALTDASKKQIVKDRKLAPAEIGIVAQNIKDRPAVRRMLQQGLVRPNELVDESYASRLQLQADTARKLPRRRRSKQVLLDRESVPSRSTRGLKYYRRAQYVRPDIWR